MRPRVWLATGLVLVGGVLGWLAYGRSRLDAEWCAMRCAREHGAGAGGTREFGLGARCRCTRDGSPLAAVPRLAPDEPMPEAHAVCGRDGRAYDDAAAARLAGTEPLHAGACGACSNATDLDVMRRTRLTLTETSTRCALRYLLFGRPRAARCMEGVGFTPGCAACWLDDMACAAQYCQLVCLEARLRGSPPNVDGRLNDCLACDETHCGPTFVRCAGASRRRAGIVSDIGRDARDIWRDDGR